jgi:hypothetical protein
MIFTSDFVREVEKIERREGVRVSGVIVTGKAGGRLTWGISWRLNTPENCDFLFLRAMAGRLSPRTLLKIAVQKLSRPLSFGGK